MHDCQDDSDNLPDFAVENKQRGAVVVVHLDMVSKNVMVLHSCQTSSSTVADRTFDEVSQNKLFTEPKPPGRPKM